MRSANWKEVIFFVGSEGSEKEVRDGLFIEFQPEKIPNQT